MNVAWGVPGRLDQLTGGYLYDRRMVGSLRAHGHRVRVVELPARLGFVDPPAALRLARSLTRPGDSWDAVVVDELAHPAMGLGLPTARLLWRAGRGVGPIGRPAVLALVHHLRFSEADSRLERIVAAGAEWAALGAVDRVVCTSRTTAVTVRRLLRRSVPVDVVPPGCEPAAGGALGTGRGAAPPDPASFRLLAVAHWTPRKGIVETLRAVALATPSLRLDLVGDPDRDPAYARRVRRELRRTELAGRVVVHSRVSADELARLYRRADALVLHSRYEGYGMVLAEALAAGLPIVATPAGAVPDLVREGLEAELVPFGDVAGLTRALVRLADDPVEWARRAAHARARAASLPTWDDSGAAFAALLERAVEERYPALAAACA